MSLFHTVRGAKDILPVEISRWKRIETTIEHMMRCYGYEEIRTPILEYADLFYRSVGEETDVVGKEMYTFQDRSGEYIALRPELTAPVARAVVQHSLAAQTSLLRLWYYGPCFRYERPQKGRQRQFHQVGAECIGSRYPDADVEIISLAWDILSNLLDRGTFTLCINTLGTPQEQRSYRDELVEYLRKYEHDLSAVSQQRFRTNPLRILDSKEESDRAVIASAPKITSVLGRESMDHYATVRSLLQQLGIPFIEDPYLVRGLDYYSHTVFELRSAALGAQDALGGGGRYDSLIASLGGQEMPGVGFGMGVERLLLAMTDTTSTEEWHRTVYIAAEPVTRLAMHTVAQWLRGKSVQVITDLQFRSLKAQLRQAHKLRCSVVIILSHRELEIETAVVRDMRTSEQTTIPFDRELLIATVQQRLE